MWIYIGKGSFLPGLPARDLTDDEVNEFGKAKVLATGLYKQPKPKASENKAMGQPKENK